MQTATRPVQAPASRIPWAQSRRVRARVQNALASAFLALGALFFIAPFVWMLSTSLKTLDMVFDPSWMPSPISWSNYSEALTSAPFDVYFRNTAIVTVFSTVGSVLSASLVAYSFARLRWPGRDFWFGVVLATMMLPGAVTMIPRYILFAKIGWVDTFLPLIVPDFLGGGAFFIFLLRQFFKGIPMELSEAARIDGASEFRIWWQIVMPLSMPVLATITIFAFNGSWQQYLDPLIYLNSEDKYTLQLGLAAFKAGGGGLPLWHYLMAASLVVMLPVVVIFLLGQRYFVESLSVTGIKG